MEAGRAAVALYEGKLALDARQYDRAIVQLSLARENLPLLADYALYWRAKAYLAAGDYDRAAADIVTAKSLAKKTVLVKPLRSLELELATSGQRPNIGELYQRYMKDYPSDMNVKLMYALHLKQAGEPERATKMLRELFTTVSSASATAQAELDPEDITADDLLKKAKNLNSGWRFADAEQAFRQALRKNSRLRASALDGLAYALFRQKRYREAADAYAQTGNAYWHARSLLRANELEAFDQEISGLLKSKESRNGALLLAYASKKRRAGDLETAFRTYQRVSSHYPSEREEALWLTGWTYYRQQEFEKALAVFSQLHARYGGLKYAYWINRAAEHSADADAAPLTEASLGTRDFYGYLTAVRHGWRFPDINTVSASRTIRADRAELLASLGFHREASVELKHLADKTSSHAALIAISEQFHRIGDYRNAIQTAVRVPYSPSVHTLHYPFAYWKDVETAAKKNGLDPHLLLAVIREESRFDSDARSVAGALGLMQLMPQTAEKVAMRIGYALDRPEALYMPGTNIMIGAAYLKSLISEFGAIPYAIAAYNAGEESVREWVRQGKHATVDEFIEDIPYYETQNYVKKVLTTYFQYLRVQNVTDTGTIQRDLGRL